MSVLALPITKAQSPTDQPELGGPHRSGISEAAPDRKKAQSPAGQPKLGGPLLSIRLKRVSLHPYLELPGRRKRLKTGPSRGEAAPGDAPGHAQEVTPSHMRQMGAPPDVLLPALGVHAKIAPSPTTDCKHRACHRGNLEESAYVTDRFRRVSWPGWRRQPAPARASASWLNLHGKKYSTRPLMVPSSFNRLIRYWAVRRGRRLFSSRAHCRSKIQLTILRLSSPMAA